MEAAKLGYSDLVRTRPLVHECGGEKETISEANDLSFCIAFCLLADNRMLMACGYLKFSELVGLKGIQREKEENSLNFGTG